MEDIKIYKNNKKYFFIKDIFITINNKEQKYALEIDQSDYIIIAFDSEENLLLSIFTDKNKDKELQKLHNNYSRLGYDISNIKYVETNKISNEDLKDLQKNHAIPKDFFKKTKTKASF